MEKSSRFESSYFDFPDFCVLQEKSCLRSISEAELDDFQDISWALTDVQLCATLTTSDNAQSGGAAVRKREEMDVETAEEMKRKENDLGTRTRSANEERNMYGKRRRNRINQKLKTLQEMIPNCHKIEFQCWMMPLSTLKAKALKLQVKNMSSLAGGGEVIIQAPYMIPCGIQSTQQFQQYCPFMGMFSRSCCPPMVRVPSATSFNPVGLSLSHPGQGEYAALHPFQMPSFHSQQLPVPIDASFSIPQKFNSTGFNFLSQGGYVPSTT